MAEPSTPFLDINETSPLYGLPLERVGVVGVRQPLNLLIDGAIHPTAAEFSLSVSLPAARRAIHMSRCIEAIREVCLSEAQPLEKVAESLGVLLLAKHPYATEVNVSLSCQVFLSRRSPFSDRPNPEPYALRLGWQGARDEPRSARHTLQVQVVGATTCPCAQNEYKALFIEALSEEELTAHSDLLDKMHFPSHMQRVTVTAELSGAVFPPISLNQWIEAIENGPNINTHALLKRRDESITVMKAFDQPRFVEDVVRLVAAEIAGLPSLPPHLSLRVRAETEESIHKHNACAELELTLAQINQYLA